MSLRHVRPDKIHQTLLDFLDRDFEYDQVVRSAALQRERAALILRVRKILRPRLVFVEADVPVRFQVFEAEHDEMRD